jgi:hypothetical protein
VELYAVSQQFGLKHFPEWFDRKFSGLGYNPEKEIPYSGLLAEILVLGAAPLRPGATKHDDTGVGPTFAVPNLKKKLRREVALLEKLKIYAYYLESPAMRKSSFDEAESNANALIWMCSMSVGPNFRLSD